MNARVARAQANLRHALARASRCRHRDRDEHQPCPACRREVAFCQQRCNTAWRDAHQERRQEALSG